MIDFSFIGGILQNQTIGHPQGLRSKGASNRKFATLGFYDGSLKYF